MKNRQMWMLVAVGVVCIASLYLLKNILMPFFMGLLVAYAMNPAVKYMERWGISRGLSTTFMILIFFLLIGIFLFIAVPFIQTELLRLAFRLPQYGERLRSILQPLIDQASQYVQPNDIERLRSLASNYMGEVLTWGIRLFAGVLTNSLALANLISLIVITPVVAFYCLRDWPKIISATDRLFPRASASTFRHLFMEINAVIGGFAKGQALVCLAAGIYYCFALTLAGLDFSLVVGVVIGIAAFIPYVGVLLGFMLSIGIAFSQFPDWFSVSLIAGIFLVGQTLEGYILIPYLVGDRIGLHPVWVIFALLAGGVLYGFIGILFALPAAAALGVLVRHGLGLYFKSSYYLGKN